MILVLTFIGDCVILLNGELEEVLQELGPTVFAVLPLTAEVVEHPVRAVSQTRCLGSCNELQPLPTAIHPLCHICLDAKTD